MSDSLKKLLGVEKQAAALLAEAEARARESASAARSDAQKARDAQSRAHAAELDQVLAAESAALAAEREKKNAAYRDELARMKTDPAPFARVLSRLVDPGT